MSSSPAYIIGNLPSPLREGNYYSIQLLSTYLCLITPSNIRQDVAQFGHYLAKGESEAHEAIALEKLKEKLKSIINGEVESRKNSWVNTLNRNLSSNNDKAVASMLASIWRRLLTETSLKKAERSAMGYALNGNNRVKSSKQKEKKALCEWCSKEITVPTAKGFTCPCCGVYFHDYRPQKVKINLSQKEWAYEESYEELSSIDRIRRGEWGLERTKLKNAAQITMM